MKDTIQCFLMIGAILAVGLYGIRDVITDNQVEIKKMEIGVIKNSEESSRRVHRRVGKVATHRTKYECSYDIELENGEIIQYQEGYSCKNGINGKVIVKHSYLKSDNSFKEYIVEFE